MKVIITESMHKLSEHNKKLQRFAAKKENYEGRSAMHYFNLDASRDIINYKGRKFRRKNLFPQTIDPNTLEPSKKSSIEKRNTYEDSILNWHATQNRHNIYELLLESDRGSYQVPEEIRKIFTGKIINFIIKEVSTKYFEAVDNAIFGSHANVKNANIDEHIYTMDDFLVSEYVHLPEELSKLIKIDIYNYASNLVRSKKLQTVTIRDRKYDNKSRKWIVEEKKMPADKYLLVEINDNDPYGGGLKSGIITYIYFEVITNLQRMFLYKHEKDNFIVRVYGSSRAYGGPEEGGWWYDDNQVTAEYKASGILRAVRLKHQLEKKYENRGKDTFYEDLENSHKKKQMNDRKNDTEIDSGDLMEQPSYEDSKAETYEQEGEDLAIGFRPTGHEKFFVTIEPEHYDAAGTTYQSPPYH